jgi:hypothetical protein
MDRILKFLAFTIIAILIFSFAFPSLELYFGSSHRRKKLPRVRDDMRILATALDSYFIDHEVFPPGVPFSDMVPGTASRLPKSGEHLLTIPSAITTPVAYLSMLCVDVFQRDRSLGLGFAYYTDGKGWILFSPGPDQDYDIADPAHVYDSDTTQPSPLLIGGPWTYDPTNGTESSGDVWRVKQ